MIRGTPLCSLHYIQALEHCADMITPLFDFAIQADLRQSLLDQKRNRDRINKIIEMKKAG